MKKNKIAVYAICKNEEKFAARWAKSMSEADEIVVLDTGSEDRSAEILSSFPKVRVFREKISPWRFDTARNRALEKVSADADWCVSTDLDELFCEGWRDKLEAAVSDAVKLIRYRYTWSFSADGTEDVVFWINKIHRRSEFVWRHPVHEVICYTGEGEPPDAFAQGLELYHYPDSTKPRGQYLSLLELSVREAPEDDRNMHYLGREYMFRGCWDECIETLRRHLELPSARWADERSASMRYIAAAYIKKAQPEQARGWLLRAAAEAPYLREPWLDLAAFCFDLGEWHGVIWAAQKALEIKERPKTYISSGACWGEQLYDLLSLAYYYTGSAKEALKYSEEAIKKAPGDGRLLKNREFFLKAVRCD